MSEKIFELLRFVYGDKKGMNIMERLEKILQQAQIDQSRPTADPARTYFDHRDAVLITYGDMVRAPDETPLQTLYRFLQKWIGGLVRGVHLLPFYPNSSDDGFSVIDYVAVDPGLGDWDDIDAFREDFRLMFDAVINHISRQSVWFQKFLEGESPYDDFFITANPQEDLSAVFRPRALPLLTPVTTSEGLKHVWTTFSDDQIDLNYRSADLLLEILQTLLFYARRGADMLRLDAIGFMWKEIGTSSIHRPQTHALIQLMRALLNEAAPHVALVTETNVPHRDNISYFGDGTNEAQMVYNFSLPPLTLHAFHSGDATVLSAWAAGLTLPSDQVTFFNFTASHDGIGLTPAKDILPQAAISAMAQRVEALGGFVSYKADSNGGQSPYELNISYIDALADPNRSDSEKIIVARFVASQAIMMALRGVPGVYFHSLFGSRSWPEGVDQSGHKRRINRQKLPIDVLEQELEDGFRRQVFDRLITFLRIRTTNRAFSPYGDQEILQLDPAVFAVVRRAAGDAILCLHNVSNRPVTFPLPFGGLNLLDHTAQAGEITLNGYEVAWLKA